jgi:hypothetical protein
MPKIPLTPTLANLLEIAFSTLRRGIWTALPGIIESYDGVRASVLPSILEIAGDGDTLANQVISNVPVIWPGSSQGSASLPLNKGDGVLLIFMSRSVDEWKGTGQVVAPADLRTHNLTDCVAIPGLFSFNNTQKAPNNTDCFIRFKEQSIIIRANGDIELGTGGSLSKLVTEAFLTFFNAHVHASVGAPPSILTTSEPAGTFTTTKTTAL